LGSLVSEGYISENGVDFNNTNEDFAHQFEIALVGSYGTSGYRYERKLQNGKTLIEYQIHNKEVIQDISSKGLSQKSGEKEVPYVVLQSPKKIQRAFLQALFEGDGSVYSGKETVVISYLYTVYS